MSCDDCWHGAHAQCAAPWCACQECLDREEWQGVYRLWREVGVFCALATLPRNEHHADDVEELCDEAEWLRRVARGDYGNDVEP